MTYIKNDSCLNSENSYITMKIAGNQMKLPTGRKLTWALALLLAAGAAGAWYGLRPAGLGEGFASGNGRIEATELDVATKLAGRVAEISVDEGDFVSQGQVLARMDTQVLEAQLAQARAEVRRAENATATARALVAQRESEKVTAAAVVAQRQAELTAAQKRFSRTRTLVARNALPQQQLDDDRAVLQSAEAALAAARAQVLSAQAGVEAAKSQVIEAQSAIEAATASTVRLAADIDDSVLRAPRAGRVQYRIAQPGEVLGSGGRVLNMVDLVDVYMTFFLPATHAGRVILGQEARLVLDAAPQYVIPAKISYVASVAQFTPKTVETASEREKLMFRVRARIDPELLKKYITAVKTGLSGMAYLRLDPKAPWPEHLDVKVPL
jgi:HlyD family secretion protein